MIRIDPQPRLHRLMCEAVDAFSLDLAGMKVLTEVASGAFVVTPLIAALAKAKQVIAVCRTTRHGNVDEVIDYGLAWAHYLGVAKQIVFTDKPAKTYAPEANIVTNLGHVRPIDRALVEALPGDSGIALMFEPWEARAEDIDFDACHRRGVPVLGTDEHDDRLQTFEYVGLLAVKLLLETGIELLRSRVIVIGSDPFGSACSRWLEQMGSIVYRVDPTAEWRSAGDLPLQEAASRCDAVVVAEHRSRRELLGTGGFPVEGISDSASIIHICGTIDREALQRRKIRVHPNHVVRPGYMSVTTDYVGPKPVVDLHAGGLRVGQALVEGMRRFGDSGAAIRHALASSPALDFPTVKA